MRRLRFTGFELKPAERLLLAGGEPLTVGARAFDVLLALIERRDRVVSKSELLELAWPGLVVEENNLSVQISSLRKLLGPQAIATVTGRGYRFALPCDEDTPSVAVHPSAGRVSRRLAAIASAGVVGWRSDEVGAAQAWRALRTELVEPQARAFGGRVIELSAAFTLLEFPSAVDAVAWAVEVQQRLATGALASMLRLRIGVNADDVILDDDKLVGEGVDVAVRLRELAAPGEVVVSATVQGLVWKKLPVSFEPMGERELEGVRRPVLVFRAHQRPQAAAPQEHPHLIWESRPTVAVLPFASDDGEADSYFGEGITEEIIATLSMNRSLLVIARNSTLRYRGRAASATQIAQELGVRYVLIGSVRRLGQRLRIHAELVDARADRVIWVDGFNGTSEDLFDFQKDIALAISGAIAPHVQEAEITRLRDRPTESYSAYDCVLKGMSVQFRFNEPDFDLAGAMFRRAIELDPQYGQAYAHLAEWHNHRAGEGISTNVAEDRGRALELSERAVELDPCDAWVLAVAGHIQSFQKKRFATAMEMFDQALKLNPSCSLAWARSGTTLAYMGRGEDALDRVRNAMRLSPFDHQYFAYCTTNGIACIVAGRWDEAVGWLGQARRRNPRYHAARRMLTVALALAGQVQEAQAVGQEFLASEPGFRVSSFAQWYPMQPPHLEKVLEGLLSAGLPP